MPAGDRLPPTTAEVQRELDGLAVALGRSVSLDHPDGTLLGYSVQGRPVDAARVQAILARQVPEAVLAYQRGFGVDDATGPVRVPANPDLQMGARTCLPVRHRRATRALLWVLDDDQPLDPDQTRLARASGDRLAHLLTPPRTADPTALLGDLFTDEPPPDLTGLVGGAQQLQFAVVSHRADDRSTAQPAAPRLARSGAVLGTASTRGRRIVLIAPTTAAGGAADLVRRLLPADRADTVIGCSASCPAGTDPGAAATLAAQAIVAADCAATDPVLPETTAWSDLGLYRRLLLTTSADDWPGPQPVPEQGRSADMLRHTLEVYLDHAGDAGRSIAALQIHRTTFYYRLDRLARLHGVDLDDGLARTAYHVALKVRRLAAARDRYGWTRGFLDRLRQVPPRQ